MKIYDSHIRKGLLSQFTHIVDYINDPNTIVVDELDVYNGVARVDIAVINGEFHGYEIKSGQDSLDRLPHQIELYNQLFDTMTIATHVSHLSKVSEIVPEWWGIQSADVVDNSISLEVVREEKENPHADPQCVAMLLWRDEMLEFLDMHITTPMKYKSKSRRQLSVIIASEFDETSISSYVRHKLKNRSMWKAVPIKQLCDDLRSM